MGVLRLLTPFQVLTFLCAFILNAEGEYVPQYLKTKYGGNLGAPEPQPSYQSSNVKTYTKTKTKTPTYGSGSGGSYPPGQGSQTRVGGCTSDPPKPLNAGIRCSKFSGCKADCIPNYQFPNGQPSLLIKCYNGEWQIEGPEWSQVPNCEPICTLPCLNNGICIAPDQCNCPENFSGPECQYENRPCLNYPPMPINARRSCRNGQCTLACFPGYEFPDGSELTTMVCKSGTWVPGNPRWTSFPDCQPTCNPPCLNGGSCLSFNVCKCPQELRGPQCQYSVQDCSPKKLQFNGGYNCSGDLESFSCSVNCPAGINFEFPPEPFYTCSYSLGVYLPKPIPQCVFPDMYEVIPGGQSSHTFYHITNNTGFDLNHISINGQPGDFNQWTDNKPGVSFPRPAIEDDQINQVLVNLPQNSYDNQDNIIFVEQKLPEPGICFTWGGSHFKTFDGKVFSFESKCAHILVKDAVDDTFSVVIKNSPDCYQDPSCHKVIQIYYQSKHFVLSRNKETGLPTFTQDEKVLPIPGQLPGVRIKMEAHYVVLSLDTIGSKIKWDGHKLVQVEIQESLWNRTEGLCGRIDGDDRNDLQTRDYHPAKTVSALATSWKVDDLESDECKDYTPSEDHACPPDQVKDSTSQKATEFCKRLINNPRFAICHSAVDISLLLDACRWDYCNCKDKEPTVCACESMNVYVRSCAFKGIKGLANWRDADTCPMQCSGGRVYKTCGPPKGQPVCGASFEHLSDDSGGCSEGCYCPEGSFLHENQCITEDKCPCILRGKSFPPGSQVPNECNTCSCTNGQWICSQLSCGARCSAVGDPHYTTFDGKKYDFMGQCSYYLVKTGTFSIEAENVACSGAISQAMKLPVSVASGLPSCTKGVTVKVQGQSIKLKQNHDVVVNGIDIVKMPYQIANVTIRILSSIFLQVELPNGVQIWWDGVTRVYVDVPANFQEKTKGLCGTFNYNQKDDFVTPEDDIEQAVVPFANKWKTNEKCNDIPDKLLSHPCSSNMQNQPVAEKHCLHIKSKVFEKCHWIVDPEPYYRDCLYDMCSCEHTISKCLCPTIAAYAAECSRLRQKVEWRNEVRECGITCPGGQHYQACGNSCTRTCFDLSTRSDCQPQCVEGCNCAEGEALDSNGDCVPIRRCTCHQDGLEFHSGYKEVRPESKGLELCTCINAFWSCRLATPQEIKQYPQTNDLKSLCGHKANMEFTTCEPAEPLTCKNMDSPDYFSPTVCHAGCKCKDGYVLDTKSKRCVKPTECPCHHGGKSYKEKSVIQEDCNSCQCQNGKWKCTDHPCAGECHAWGDSHFKTFDGKEYDFQGQCDYQLSKGSLGPDSFNVAIQSVPCGSLGTTCSKAVTIRIKSGDHQDTLVLTKDKQLPEHVTNMKHVTIRQKGLLVLVEAPDLGLVVQWDKGTRVYVKVDPRWKDHVKGLCGNYNDNELDDFQTPSGGVPEVSAKMFGDSWKLQDYCPEALEVTNTCEDRPDRKVWALKQCGVLKSPLFAPCHSEVPINGFLDKCIFDTCACDQGGDCACLCTALAAYAQECNNRGVSIKWRSQELCPMQCDERCTTYSPCVSTCPTETCDNLLTQNKLSKFCKEETCIEGCSPKPCPPDYVHLNSSLLECVPRNSCKPVCLTTNETTYFEGDLMEEDPCHSCYCSRGERVCKGQPCETTLESSTPNPTTYQLEQIVQCQSGWTDWINQDKAVAAKGRTKKSDTEPLPSALVMNAVKGGKCSQSEMVDIECRTVKTHVGHKKTGLNVECSLERGLVCKSTPGGKPCKDFEIRVKCQCEQTTTTTPPPGCDPSHPHREHPTDCHKYFQCVDSTNGTHYVEQTCGPSMYYNPVSMTCDWPYAVTEIKPECRQLTTTSLPLITLGNDDEEGRQLVQNDDCPPGMVKEDCAVQCDRLCLFYDHVVKQSGSCQNGGSKCESGCVHADKKLSCPSGMFWANNHTCVAIYDCLCRSNDGKPVKPGTIYRESDCRICQCINNFYTCDDSACHTTTSKPQKVVMNVVEAEYINPVPISTVTPPEACDEDRYMNLIQGDQHLPDSSFNASSVRSNAFKPEYSRFDDKLRETTGASWVPAYTNSDQYLEINLGQLEPIYGVILKGSPIYTEFVTSYKVFYSTDGDNFVPILNRDRLPQIFRGSVDCCQPVRRIFDVPIEAKVVRINPQTWENGIALRVELVGCGDLQVTTTVAYEFITIGQKVPICDDAMGLSDGTMEPQQVTISSELRPEHGKESVSLSSDSPWQPLVNSPTEFIQIDFLEPRNITGLVTKGGPEGWVTQYSVMYSHNNKAWNKILDNGKEKVFAGNFDQNSPHVNNFDLPIRTRYIRVVPVKWQDNIQMRLEVQGCFEPYPTVVDKVTTPPSTCTDCPGVQHLEIGCRCENGTWWDGDKCVARTECPCVVGHIKYPVGSLYEEEDCSHCVCKLAGISHCEPKQCEACNEGLRSKVTSTCKCTCQPCPDGTTLCPTSNICINSTLWCNGFQDCPDDEINCGTTPKPTTEKPKEECPVVVCPPGYKRLEKKSTKVQRLHSYLSPMFTNYGSKSSKTKTTSYYNGLKTGGGGGAGVKTKRPNPQRQTAEVEEQQICPEFRCQSEKPPPDFIRDQHECPLASCPKDFVAVVDERNKEVDIYSSKECPKYDCYPKPAPDAVCNVTGRTFNTFDQTEYKYDICNHVLARDLNLNEWDISLKKSCVDAKICTRDLIINHQDNVIVLHPDLTVEFDGFKYTVDQTKKIGSELKSFSISRLGNTLFFVSNRYGFWIIWDDRGNVKLGAVRKLEGQIDGLCGFFNGKLEDDKRKPDGSPARTTVEFGDSWVNDGQVLPCETKTCPLSVQSKAWEYCNKVKERVLAPCAKVIDIEAFISRCLESTCECLQSGGDNHTHSEQCRCHTLQSFVVDCLTADPSTDLTDWRTQMDCPVSCESPLIYHDCYQRKCEPTCESISDPSICSKVPHVCFPGCYCPPGLVKKGDTCIKPSNCKDCECNVLPHLQYITYDNSNFTVNGNCVYVMSRDALEGTNNHAFQVLITNAPCKTNVDKTCVGKVTILYQGRKIHILNDLLKNKLKLIVDGERIDDMSEVAEWADIRETAAKHFKILLVAVQIEVSVYFPSLGVSVKASSQKYGGKLEGLCGNCNKDPHDDLKTSSGQLTDQVNDFSLSWLYEHLPGGQSREQCGNKEKDECPPLPDDQDPCNQILDYKTFGQCLRVLDPSLFIDWCKKDSCGNHPELACAAIEAYARDCASSGFCIDWRNKVCPPKTCPSDQAYDPCGPKCPLTCDQKDKSHQCPNVPVEGCFCPPGKVLRNATTCVDVKDCEVCDEEGHHPGDEWNKDKCTTCRCEGTALRCDTQHCSEDNKICQKGYQSIRVPSQVDQCCETYMCVPEPTVGPICETPQNLVCGPGQITKLDTKPNGCQQFICECKPSDQCEALVHGDSLAEGIVEEIDTNGCCPVSKLVCKTDLCPKPAKCPQYYTLKNESFQGVCCPFYTCEPPPNKCIFETEFTASDQGGERPNKDFERQKLLKGPQDNWNDGPCRQCKCLLTSIGNYQSSCTRTNCPPIDSSHEEYEVEPRFVYDQCCPDIERVACKFDGRTYQVGQKWTKPGDFCTTFECVNGTSGVQKETKVTHCDMECEPGFEYQGASVESKQCCGSCKPYACVVDGRIQGVGDEWQSADFCTKFVCLNINGSIQVQAAKVNCPEMPPDFVKNYIFETHPVKDKCCKEHKTTGCKAGEREYQIGDTFPSPDGDKCKKITCERKPNGDVVKTESIESCKTECPLGSTYRASNATCCGACVQEACVVDGSVKKLGQNWTSDDNCTTFTCERLSDDQFVVSSQQESCPALDDCPEENIYVKGCCKHCNITSLPQVLCSPEPIKLGNTIGMIKVFKPESGLCINQLPIEGFTECKGICHSSTFFNFKSGSHESQCSCCQALAYNSIEVDLVCEDGHSFKKNVAIPSSCGCDGCSALSPTSPSPGYKNKYKKPNVKH